MREESNSTKEVLESHRDTIDRLDAILVYTLAERFKHTQEIGKIKAKNKIEPSDPKRELKQIQRLERLSKEAGLDQIFAKKLLNFVISEVIKHHENLRQLS